MVTLTIVVPGEPVAKGRPRMSRIGHVYTPQATRDWEKKAKQIATAAVNGQQFNGPLSVSVEARFAVPKSWPAWKRAMALAGEIAHTQKPDGDNIAKAAIDALNEIAFADDAQIVSIAIEKRYAIEPLVAITIRPLIALPAQVKKNPHRTVTV